MDKKVYIILLNYNGWKDTVECVKSLAVIKGTDTHIVVVDNCSTDDSVERLKTELADEVTLLLADENNGFSAGNNIGIRYALKNQADYVLLLNNDTVTDQDFLTPLVEFASRTPDCGCISSRIYYYYDKNKIWFDGGAFHPYNCRAEHYRFDEDGSTVTGIHEATFISGCCMLIPATVIRKIGLMDERYFLYVEDTEYSLRIQKVGYKLYWDADHHIYHKVSASTGNKSKLSQYYEIRNRLLLSKDYLLARDRFSMHLYNIIFYAYKLATKKYDLKTLQRALSDFNKGTFGKQYEKGSVC